MMLSNLDNIENYIVKINALDNSKTSTLEATNKKENTQRLLYNLSNAANSMNNHDVAISEEKNEESNEEADEIQSNTVYNFISDILNSSSNEQSSNEYSR